MNSYPEFYQQMNFEAPKPDASWHRSPTTWAFYLNANSKNRVDLENKKYFHIDGFPRQGSSTLREILFRLHPTMHLPDPLQHNPEKTQTAIDKGYSVICTIRNPVDCITSFASMNQGDHKDWSPQKLKQLLNVYYEYCLCIVENYNKIIVVDFNKTKKLYKDYITGNEKNNETLKMISKKYSIEMSLIKSKKIKDLEIIPDSTYSFEVKNQLYTDSYFLNNIEKLIDIYKTIIR